MGGQTLTRQQEWKCLISFSRGLLPFAAGFGCKFDPLFFSKHVCLLSSDKLAVKSRFILSLDRSVTASHTSANVLSALNTLGSHFFLSLQTKVSQSEWSSGCHPQVDRNRRYLSVGVASVCGISHFSATQLIILGKLLRDGLCWQVRNCRENPGSEGQFPLCPAFTLSQYRDFIFLFLIDCSNFDRIVFWFLFCAAASLFLFSLRFPRICIGWKKIKPCLVKWLYSLPPEEPADNKLQLKAPDADQLMELNILLPGQSKPVFYPHK